MTSNYQRALELADHIADVDESPRELVKQLHQNGLLMPDLPKPTIASIKGYHRNHPWAEWDIGDWVVGVNKHGGIWTREDNNPLSETVLTDEARGIALALLAAANYAEEESL